MKIGMQARGGALLAFAVILAGCNAGASALPTVVLGDQTPAPRPAAASTPAAPSPAGIGGVTASGFVAPAQQVQIVSAAGGRARAVHVAVGDRVAQGQVLVELDDAALQAQAAQARAALAAAQADYDLLAAGPTAEQLRQAEAAVIVATASYSRTLGGARKEDISAAQAAYAAAAAAYQKVKAGPQPEDMAAALAGLRSAEAALKQAQARYDDANRRNPAGIGGDPAALALEQATNAYAAARALYDLAARPADQAQLSAAYQAVESARAALERARKPATEYDIAQARAQLQAAQAQYDAVKAGTRAQQLDVARAQIASAQAQVHAIEVQLAQVALAAPITGTVSRLDLHAGEWVAPAQPILALADLDHLRVETTDLSELDVPRVAVGQPVSVFVKALNQAVAGHVAAISPLAETLGGDVVYKVTVDLDEQPPALRSGMSAEVRFQ